MDVIIIGLVAFGLIGFLVWLDTHLTTYQRKERAYAQGYAEGRDCQPPSFATGYDPEEQAAYLAGRRDGWRTRVARQVERHVA